MADNSVFISGAASGAFVDAMDGLPPWATEKTALNIESLLKKSLAIQTKMLSQLVKNMSGGGNSKNIQSVDDELGKLLKNIQQQNAQMPIRKKRWKDEDDEHLREKKRWQNRKAWYEADGVSMAMFAKVALGAKGALEQNVDTFDLLYRSGVDLVSGFNDATNGFEALQQMSILSGVRYTELAKSMVKFNTAVNSFGAEKFIRTISGASIQLRGLGYSTKEAADLLGVYIDSQQGYANVNAKTQSEVQKDLVRFGDKITKLSLATGMTRDALLDNIQAIAHSTEVNLLAGRIGADAAESTSDFIASFKDKNLGNSVLRMMTDTIKPLNETFGSFQKLGYGGFVQKYQSFVSSLEAIKDPQEQSRLYAEFVKANTDEMTRMEQQSLVHRQGSLKADYEAMLSITTAMKRYGREYKVVSKEESDKLQKTSESTKAYANAVERLKSQWQQIFAPSIETINFITGILEGINSMAELIREGVEKIEDFIDSFEIIHKNIGKINLLPWTGMILAFGAFIGGVALLRKSVDFIWKRALGFGKIPGGSPSGFGGGSPSGFGGGGPGGFGGSGSGKQGPGFLEKLGKGIGAIGKGLGTGLGGLIGNFLSGLAKGLSALGTPKVLLGTISLTGIAGAMIIAGKAVKEFTGVDWESLGKAGAALTGIVLISQLLGLAKSQMMMGAAGLLALSGSLYIAGEGLQKFNNVKWEDIGKAITTLGALGVAAGIIGLPPVAGPVAIGTGLLAALSGVLWIFGKAAESAGPGITALAKGFSEFSKIDGKNLLLTATGIVSLSSALAAFAIGGTIASVGNILGSISDGLSKLLGGNTIVDKLKAFANIGPGLQIFANAVNIIGGSIKSLSETLNSFSGIDTLKSIVNTINNLDIAKASAVGRIVGIPGNTSMSSLTPSSRVANPSTPRISVLSPQESKNDNQTEVIKAKEPTKSAAAGIEKAPSNTNIDSMLSYQNSLLEQLLLSTNNLVSVNKDILKYTRVHV